MSRRAIKRYEQELESEKVGDSESSLEVAINKNSAQSTDVSPLPGGHQALFALLGEEEDDTSDSGPEENEVIGLTANNQESGVSKLNDKATAESIPSNNNNLVKDSDESKGGKKKKRKKKGKNRHAKDHETDPDWIALNEADSNLEEKEDRTPGWIPASYFTEEDSEDVKAEAVRIMASIEAVVLSERQQNPGQESNNDRLKKVLHVEPRLLNADAELKRLFGSRVIESERRAEEAGNNSISRQRGRAGGRSALRRKVNLVSLRENWYPEAPGLVMELDTKATETDTSGVRYYRYVHEATYARIQDEYRALVSSHDPNLLVELSSRYPYHVDTLLQLAEVYRQMGELDRAAEMVERCLYVLETSWNISFKPYDGNCRLCFDVLENRALYVALFRYSQLLTRRGLHRTALEISKLLLNLDSERDPMGMLMLADSFALLSGEYRWIQDMRTYYAPIPVQYFPNFSASSALAAENVRLGISGISNRGRTGKTRVGGRQGPRHEESHVDTNKGDELLTDALLTFPMLLRPLLSAIQDDSGVWTEHRLFDEAWYGAGVNDNGVLTRMSRVYAERSKLLWNSTSNKQLLLRCARAAGELDTAAGTGVDPNTGHLSPVFVKNVSEHSRAARCRALRAEAGEWLRTSGLYHALQISDFADSTTNLPAELLAGEGGDRTVGAPAPRNVTLAESAMEFLQSLLPWRETPDIQ